MSLTDQPFHERDLRKATGLRNLEVRTNPDDLFKVDITVYGVDVPQLLGASPDSIDDAYNEGYREGEGSAEEAVEQGHTDAELEFRNELTSMLSAIASGMESVEDELADLCRRRLVNPGLIERALPRKDEA